MNAYYTAQEAADLLGIQVNTLYSYVSRGLLRSEENTADKSRARRYLATDVDRLLARQEARRNPKSVVPRALNWGDPILSTAVTLIQDSHLFYRGYDALTLAQTRPFEAVCRLLWLDYLETETAFEPFPLSPIPLSWSQVAPLLAEGVSPFEAFQIVLPLVATADLAAYDQSASGIAATGARLLPLLTSVATRQPITTSTPIANHLQEIWASHHPPSEASFLLNAALILCADHELNASSFAARVAASTGANPYAVVQAGLATLSGPKHGGQTRRVEAWLREAEQVGVRLAIAERLKRGERVAGFGHQLYPEGDPRGRFLLTAVAERFPSAPVVTALNTAMALLPNQYPTLDVGLVAVAHALELPPGAPLALFALGRTAGWLAQAQEQYTTKQLVRPRATYTGRPPVTS
jgi:citrate synthase